MAKIRTGIVVSNKMNKTAIVQVDRMVPHKKYGKRYRVSAKFAAHDELNTAEIGDLVTIREIRPMSKTKTWELVAKGDVTQTLEAEIKAEKVEAAATPKRATKKKVEDK